MNPINYLKDSMNMVFDAVIHSGKERNRVSYHDVANNVSVPDHDCHNSPEDGCAVCAMHERAIQMVTDILNEEHYKHGLEVTYKSGHYTVVGVDGLSGAEEAGVIHHLNALLNEYEESAGDREAHETMDEELTEEDYA